MAPENIKRSIQRVLAALETKYMAVTLAYITFQVAAMIIVTAFTLAAFAGFVYIAGWAMAPLALVVCITVLNGYGKYMASHIDRVLATIKWVGSINGNAPVSKTE